MEDPGFWDDPDRSNRLMKELKALKGTVEQGNHLKTQYEDIETLIEMAYEEEDADMVEEITNELEDFKKTYEEIASTYPQKHFGWLGLLLCETKKFTHTTPDMSIVENYYSKTLKPWQLINCPVSW